MAATDSRWRGVAPEAILAAGVIGGAATMWLTNQNGLISPAPAAILGTLYVLLSSAGIVVAIWVMAMGLGWPIRRYFMPGLYQGWIGQAAAGLAALWMIDWLLAWAGLLNAVTAWALLLPASAGLAWQVSDPAVRAKLRGNLSLPRLPWTLALFGPPIGVMLVAVSCPAGSMWAIEAFGYDVLSYHLQLPREWLEQGAMAGLDHNVYSYLPGLVEAGYMQVAAMAGGGREAVYPAQLLHATTAMLAAAAIAATVARRVGGIAGAAAGAVFLAMPWTVALGSMAYNEMGAIALGAAGMMVAFDDVGRRLRGAVMVGALVGAATLCKLTAGPSLAVPLGGVLLFGLHGSLDQRRWRRRLKMAGLAAAVGMLILLPYFARNAAWTGNPVFPFMTGALGTGHWTAEQAAVWRAKHFRSALFDDVGGAVVTQWLLSRGYGAIGGVATERDDANVAQFSRRHGVPIVWPIAMLGLVLALARHPHRRVAIGLTVMLGVQILFWMLWTHHQSRFLAFTMLPGAVLVGLAAAELMRRRVPRGVRVACITSYVAVLTGLSMTTVFAQTKTFRDPQTGELARLGVWQTVDSMGRYSPEEGGRLVLAGDHPVLNHLGSRGRLMLVADASSLLYIDSPFTYATAWDRSPLGDLIREHDGDPIAITRALKEAGYTHVWIHWSELARLRERYGYDDAVTFETLRRLTEEAAWMAVDGLQGRAAVYRLP